MAKVLFLAHRVPYPPNKGEKIRSFNIFRHLARSHDMWLGTLADDAEELSFASWFEDQCQEVRAYQRSRFAEGKSAALAALTGGSMSVSCFDNAPLHRWCADAMERVRPDFIYAYSSCMAQYVPRDRKDAGLIVDFVDVDSEKYRQYAAARPGPLGLLYKMEADRLLRYDCAQASRADACLFVSETETRTFTERCAGVAEHCHTLANGVDLDYFAPRAVQPAELGPEPSILFAGRMDYRPNVDAVVWFAEEILPLVRRARPDAVFRIVGARPSPQVLALERHPGVKVVGAVEDMRPYYLQAAVAVAPMRMGRGIQNKVLEAMAMERPTIVTPLALDGISAVPGEHVLVSDGAAEFAEAVRKAIGGDDPLLGRRARARIVEAHGWDAVFAKLDGLLSAVRVKR